MSNLEGIVPPLDLCKQIPVGTFFDCTLAWINIGDITTANWMVVPRSHGLIYALGGHHITSAPTLVEIMAKLPKCVEYRWFDDGFYPSHPKHYAGDFADPDPTAAALKLWLELNKEKKK